MIQLSELKAGQSIRYIGPPWSFEKDVHFTVNDAYRIYTKQEAYPSMPLSPEDNILIIWCDEISIHAVENLKPSEWVLDDTPQ